MDTIIKYLKDNSIKYDIGYMKDSYYFKTTIPSNNLNTIRVFLKTNDAIYFYNKMATLGVILIEESKNNAHILYRVEDNNLMILVSIMVKSHIQLPRMLLSNYKTNEGFFFIDSKDGQIKRISIDNYNTEIGYYSVRYEEYLSAKYENELSKVFHSINNFINGHKKVIEINNLRGIANNIFFMAFIRNPQNVKSVNEKSYFSSLFEDGFNAEFLTSVNEKINKDYIHGFYPIILINKTNSNIVTIKSLISNLNMKDGTKCMIMLIHPRFSIILVPFGYKPSIIKNSGVIPFLEIGEEKEIIKLNKQIYNYSKINKEDTIGMRKDLILLKNDEK